MSLLKDCRRTLQPRGIIFYHHCDRIVNYTAYNIESLFAQAGLKRFRTIYWYQGTSVQQSPHGPTPVVEYIYLLTRDSDTEPPRFYKDAVPKQFRTTLWDISKTRTDDHPCVFPALLVEMCIRLNTTEGDVILDPHAGSGSVLLTAHNLGRRYIGFDIDAGYQQVFMDAVKAEQV